MIKPWKTRASRELFSSGVFRLRVDECELPDGRVMPRYYVLEFPDWANVVPVTDDGEIVLVEQFRHAGGETTLEIPGGSTDPSDPDVASAVRRELLEETGFEARDLRLIGRHRPNPAMQNNVMHTYIGFGCRQIAEPAPDPYEDLRVVLKPIPDVYRMILDGSLGHSIVAASLLYALPHLDYELPKPPRPQPGE